MKYHVLMVKADGCGSLSMDVDADSERAALAAAAARVGADRQHPSRVRVFADGAMANGPGDPALIDEDVA